MRMERVSFLAIKKKYVKLKKGNVRLTQSTLYLMQVIDPNTKVYTYPVLNTENNIAPQPEEIRLNINDEFIAYQVGYFVKGEYQGGSGNSPYMFTNAPVELSEKFNLTGRAWWGNLSIAVNNIKRLENWDLRRHLAKTRTQFQNSSAGINQATEPSIDLSETGWYNMQPMLTLSGAKKNEIVTTHPYAITNSQDKWTVATGNQITVTMDYLMLGFRGMLAQNASKFQ